MDWTPGATSFAEKVRFKPNFARVVIGVVQGLRLSWKRCVTVRGAAKIFKVVNMGRS